MQATQPPLISDQSFSELIARRGSALLGIADSLLCRPLTRNVLTRPLLGELLSQSAQLEELLDAYGAGGNHRWHPFRSLTAAIKLFSGVSYELCHLQHAIREYQLIPIEPDFNAATSQALDFSNRTLVRAIQGALIQARQLGLPVPLEGPGDDVYVEQLPPGRLPNDRTMRQVSTVSETVAHLATAFLHLEVDSEIVNIPAEIGADEYASYVPDPISEENLRRLQDRFHSLQSLYDTHVSSTATENGDTDLRILRSHVSIVFHLLRIATALCHYYERHIMCKALNPSAHKTSLVDTVCLLDVLFGYSIAYAGHYLAPGQRLCQSMLQRYAEIGRIDVPLPRYRGFHVRPSTLVSKIVLHYGSEVAMELEGESYDAASPMDIFRANEKINAKKREWLMSEIGRLPLMDAERPDLDIRTAIRRTVLTLAESEKIVIYEHPLQLADGPPRASAPLLELVGSEVARLQAMGKIDIDMDLTVSFVGDKRVLADIGLLAKAGYGEDDFGNNVLLPETLAYLRR